MSERAGLTVGERERAEHVAAALATALGALCEIANNGSDMDARFAAAAIEDVNAVALGSVL